MIQQLNGRGCESEGCSAARRIAIGLYVLHENSRRATAWRAPHALASRSAGHQ